MLLYNSPQDKTTLFDTVFRKSTSFKENTEYIIITGYIGYSTPEELINLGFKNVKVIIGMYGSSVRPELHSILLRVQRNNPNIHFFYTNGKIHSKIYIWKNKEKVQEYAIGSANFSLSTALVENLFRETLDLFQNELESSETPILQYLEDIEQFLIPIDSYSITLDESKQKKHEALEERGATLSLLSSRATPSQPNILGFTTETNGVPVSSGLNWGFSNGLPLLGDAYIPISTEFVRNNPTVISPKQAQENIPIEVLWDDGETSLMLMEGNMDVDGVLYPKQISTYKGKTLLGTYLRKRIGNKIGKNLNFSQEEIDEVKSCKSLVGRKSLQANIFNSIKLKLITKEMLDKYGRNTIDIKKLENGTYYFDFSV